VVCNNGQLDAETVILNIFAFLKKIMCVALEWRQSDDRIVN
jgi:hypothetical protein